MLKTCDGTFGIFLDFMSLMQKDSKGQRTEAEQQLFGMAFKQLAVTSEWYSHPYTFVFKVTKLPDNYPKGFRFDAYVGKDFKPNKADYYGRGWSV